MEDPELQSYQAYQGRGKQRKTETPLGNKDGLLKKVDEKMKIE
jgi:hypothetical protein